MMYYEYRFLLIKCFHLHIKSLFCVFYLAELHVHLVNHTLWDYKSKLYITILRH